MLLFIAISVPRQEDQQGNELGLNNHGLIFSIAYKF